jgi:pimeloyl-ACP methyl ester carboxylesterase
MIDPSTPVIILHGLGNRIWTLIGLEWYLNWHGFTDVHRPQYNADALPISAANQVSNILMERFHDDQTQPIVVIGNSMGGLVAVELARFGWKIELAIMINSPLNGATLLRELDDMLPVRVMDVCGGNTPTYTYLKRRVACPIPPHPYKTIGTNLPFLNFDALVYEKDAMIEPEHHHRIGWGSHHTVIVDPRVYFEILRILQSQ